MLFRCNFTGMRVQVMLGMNDAGRLVMRQLMEMKGVGVQWCVGNWWMAHPTSSIYPHKACNQQGDSQFTGRSPHTSSTVGSWVIFQWTVFKMGGRVWNSLCSSHISHSGLTGKLLNPSSGCRTNNLPYYFHIFPCKIWRCLEILGFVRVVVVAYVYPFLAVRISSLTIL